MRIASPQAGQVSMSILNTRFRLGDLPQPEIFDWLEGRCELIAAGRSSLRVGHVDLLARPTRTR